MGHQMLRAAQEARGRLESLRLPLLVMQGDADRYVVPAGAAELYERASSADKTLKWWPGLPARAAERGGGAPGAGLPAGLAGDTIARPG